MGKEFDPWTHLLHSPWRFGSSNCGSSLQQPHVNTNFTVFPTYFNPYGCAFSGNNAATPFPGFEAHRPLPKTPASIPPSIHAYGLPEFTNPQKRFLVFDHSGNQTNLIFSSSGTLFMSPGPLNPGLDLQGSKETNVSDGHGGEEMHEDTEEIDALLYSDSDDDQEEEEGSTGQYSPAEMTAGGAEEVASSTVPAKRRRVDVELDASLADTASSAVAVAEDYHILRAECRNKDTSDDAESSCVRGREKRELEGEELGKRHDSNHGNKRLKRARIQETVGVLRRIIPGGKGKDVATILDEAIRCLMSLKPKTKTLGAASPL